MNSELSNLSSPPPAKSLDGVMPSIVQINFSMMHHFKFSAFGILSWAKSLKVVQLLTTGQDDLATENAGNSTVTRFTSAFRLQISPKSPV